RPLPPATLFPYTTLFRSSWRWTLPVDGLHCQCAATPPRGCPDHGWLGRQRSSRAPPRRSARDLGRPAAAASAPERSCASFARDRSEEHTSELQSRSDLVC